MPLHHEAGRQLAVHSCFYNCKRPRDCLTGFDEDQRLECDTDDLSLNQDLLCVNPDLTPCEKYITPASICLDSENTVCVDWQSILWAVIITNCLQLVFEASMLYSMETNLRPTYLDKL